MQTVDLQRLIQIIAETSSTMIWRNSAFSLCGEAGPSEVISSCAAPLIAPSGFRISCARPAAISPSAARRSRSLTRSYACDDSITRAAPIAS